MEYVIGIDSGGTHYRVRACGLDGRFLGEYTGPTANHYLVGREEMQSRINSHISRCLDSFEGVPEDCRCLVCGTTGLDSDEDAELLNAVYNGLPGFHCPMFCMNDAELAHYTVTGGWGVLVISGTGSIAFGRSRRGETARVGGWALSIMGEEGSGSWVSRYALRHLARYFDKTVPETPMTKMLRKELGITTPKQLADLSARITDDIEKQPNLGLLVDQAAGQGDRWAAQILEGAARETLGLVSELLRVLHMEDDREIPVGVWGSNIVDSPLHQEAFARLLREKYPNTRLCLPKSTAVEGAIHLALERLKELELKA